MFFATYFTRIYDNTRGRDKLLCSLQLSDQNVACEHSCGELSCSFSGWKVPGPHPACSFQLCAQRNLKTLIVHWNGRGREEVKLSTPFFLLLLNTFCAFLLFYSSSYFTVSVALEWPSISYQSNTSLFLDWHFISTIACTPLLLELEFKQLFQQFYFLFIH